MGEKVLSGEKSSVAIKEQTTIQAPEPNTFEDTAEVRQQIVSQIAYYFGDYNLSRDTFLQNKLKEDPEGWVPMETMIKFNRLRSLCSDPAQILTILSDHYGSPSSTTESVRPFVRVDVQGSRIARDTVAYPLPPDFGAYVEALSKNSVYAKGFPKNATLEEISAFLSQGYGPVLNVFMRHYVSPSGDKKAVTAGTTTLGKSKSGSPRLFKGSIFATFEAEADAQKFLAAPSVKYHGHELIGRVPRNEYEAQKKVEYEERQSKNKKGASKQKGDGTGQDQDATVMNRVEQLIQKGNILHVTGFSTDPGSKNSRHTIKEALDGYGKVAWIDYEPGDAQAFVRFTGGNNVARDVLTKMSCPEEPATGGSDQRTTDPDLSSQGAETAPEPSEENGDARVGTVWKMKLGEEQDLIGRILGGEEELKYWVDIVNKITKSSNAGHQGKRKSFKQSNRGGGRGNNKSSGFKRKRNAENESGQNKSLKT